MFSLDHNLIVPNFQKVLNLLTDDELYKVTQSQVYIDVVNNNPCVINMKLMKQLIGMIDNEIANRAYDRAMKIL